ncbi:Cof-type HAD-IIB family hydrolase [Atopobacter phocae]|uniref:Cof-type HAD-IIB family hydrolase n=1 Tax=Atopobacter phocae TaxID=136492 RepID=UPI0004723568|nr:Cof-type HAD-IIB family hydrolase [Atopobacter phocae]
MNKKLIAIDLDGTTLNDQSQLSSYTINVLRKLDTLGHLVIIITGRPYRNSKAIYDEINIDQPLVNFNGALCHYPKDAEWQGEYHVGLDRLIAIDVSQNYKELNSDLIIVEERNHIFATSHQLPVNQFFPESTPKPILLTKDVLKVDPTAVTIFTAKEDQESVKNQLIERYGEVIDVRTWGGAMPCLEMVANGVHKGLALKHLMEYYGIAHEDTMAFGDEANDLEMIEFAHHGVALKNAIPELKAVANYVTEYTNDENGLARYLNEYFELNMDEE